MEKLKPLAFVLTLLFIFAAFASVSYSAGNDKWEQCTKQGDHKSANGVAYSCCNKQWRETSTCKPFDFIIDLDKSSDVVAKGGSTKFHATVTATSTESPAELLTISCSNRPAGISCSPAISCKPEPTCGSDITISTSTTIAAGTYNIIISGDTGKGLKHDTTFTLVVKDEPDFQISSTPSSRTITQGESTTYKINLQSINKFDGTVKLAVDGPCPIDASCIFDQAVASLAADGTSQVTFGANTKSSTPAGNYKIKIIGTSGSLSHPIELSLTVNEVIVNPGTLTGTVTDTITKAPISGTIINLVLPTGLVFSSVQTDTQGKYAIENIPAGAYTATATASGYNTQSNSVTITAGQTTTKDFALTSLSGSVTVILPQCSYLLSLKNLPKSNTYKGTSYTWDITVQERSTNCGPSITYAVPSISLFSAESCDSQSGIYTSSSNPPAGTKLTYPHNLPLTSGSDSNVFKVFVKSRPGRSCTLSFDFKVGSLTVDPSFTTNPSGVPPQSPHIGFFGFSGDTSAFTTDWEAFYPDDNPAREMKVKCGLNCDPEIQDCSQVQGKACLPYDAPQTGDVKKGSCSVLSPAYDFSTTNRIICLFYDPANSALKTRTSNDFTPADFDARTSNKITTTVGKAVELKIDISNKGLIPDSYTITLTPPNAVDATPSTITTGLIGPGKTVSATTSVTPLVDTNGKLDITITSGASPKSQTLKVQLEPGFFALPEFELPGLIQIMILAGAVYFLFIRKFAITPSRVRKRR